MSAETESQLEIVRWYYLFHGENIVWYVIQVYTGTEEEICEQCRRQVLEKDEDVFVLLAEKMIKIQGKWKLITSRLFPGYMFVETDRIEDFFMRLKKIESMTKILRTGDEMTPIHQEEEEYLRMLSGDKHIVKYSEGYMEGEKLMVASGALRNYKGTVKKILRHNRLVVLEVPLMGRRVEVTIGLGVVKRQ